MSVAEFIKEHPDYKPRIGSELDKTLRKAAMQMLKSGELTKEQYDRRFSVKRAGTTKTV